MKIKPGLFALIVGGFVLISLMFFVYAFMQQAEAKRQAAIAIENERKVTECKLEALKLNQQLNDQTQQLALQKIQLLAEQAASKSKNKK